ncbi:methyl-accepting chemotaxis protein [Clostridium sp. HBUAS56010]|uniref:methyl-accepting chemotaxis protein n=1 Tax=Clostridium sp. HBUAS56010 TaxID=2571127 RepID=UPI0011789156|nr:methyl-accepting chemotaxis protein [Clostridium sp. HBUAS56010]
MNDQNTEQELLQSFYNVIPYLSNLYEEDVAVGLTDTQRFIMVVNGNSLKFNIEVGDQIPVGGAVREALISGRVIVKDVSADVYGVPFKSYAVPILGGNRQVIGVLTLGKSLENRNQLIELIDNLTNGISQITESTDRVSSGMEQLKNMNGEISENVTEASASARNTDGIVNFVKDISTQTNLLGLNAAIEAARAGEAGRGFTVVAGEIRKMSASTSDSISQIDTVLKDINASISTINNRITESNQIFIEETQEFKNILDSIHKLNVSAKNLEKLMEKF